ncbi:MAG: choice-of-anchor C family protein [Methanothrix sp.]
MDINGGFEKAAVDPGAGYVGLSADDTTINGWFVSGNGIDYIGGYWQPSEGSRSIDLSGGNAGAISTTLNTVPGTTYRLFFDMAGNPDGEPYEKVLRVWTDDKYQEFTFNTKDKTYENMGWQTKSLEFIATTSATLLKFEGLTTTPWGPALDNVRVMPPGGDGPNTDVNLTGVWSCDDGGIYYIRQLEDIVWWDGEEASDNPSWANVARGTIRGDTVTLDYADVPEGNSDGYGTLVLDIISNDELKAREKPESYGGSRWVRSSNEPQPPPVVTNPWDDPYVRQLIDEWLQQQDKCAKKIYPSTYIDKWCLLCGDTGKTTLSCVHTPDHPPDWDNYHYLWVQNECKNYYPYRVQDYVNRRQSGSSFEDLAECKGWDAGCY